MVQSDHRPLGVSVTRKVETMPSSFRFMNTKHPGFMEVVREYWEMPMPEKGMAKLQQKLYHLKQHLRWWNKMVFGNVFDRLKEAETEVAEVKHVFEWDSLDENLCHMNRASQCYFVRY